MLMLMMWEMIKVLLWFLNPRTSLHQKTYLTVPSKMEILRESCTMYKPDKLSARIARVTFPSPHLLTLVTKLENFESVLIVCQLWGLQYHVVWREFQNFCFVTCFCKHILRPFSTKGILLVKLLEWMFYGLVGNIGRYWKAGNLQGEAEEK